MADSITVLQSQVYDSIASHLRRLGFSTRSTFDGVVVTEGKSSVIVKSMDDARRELGI